MKLENRYIVIKLNDVVDNSPGLAHWQISEFFDMCNAIAANRVARGKKELDALVIEKDWPEYEPTLALLSERVDKEAAADQNDNIGMTRMMYITGRTRTGGRYEILGLFSSPELAEARCNQVDDWVGPIEVDKNLPEQTLVWPDLYFFDPLNGRREQPHLQIPSCSNTHMSC